VVLSGSLDDGAAGAVTVTRQGGRLFVQDLDEALYGGMPSAAAAAVGHATTAPVKKLAPLLTEWVHSLPEPVPSDPSYLLEMETEMAGLDPTAMHMIDRPGQPAGFGCPDCAGGLYRIEEGGLVRFRCRVGHAWSAESLLARQTIEMESALWMALRSLEERSALNSDLHDRALHEGQTMSASRFRENSDEARRAAELVRRLIAEIGGAAR
jgi:two-component system chemotaxis response regulator CheB